MSDTVVPVSAPSSGRQLDRRWLAAVGLLVIVVAAVLYVRGGSSENLAQTGGHTVGVVEGYQSGTAVPNQILVVDYAVNKANYRARITLDSSAPAFKTAQSVTVYYNPSAPTDVEVDGYTSNDSKNRPFLLTVVLALVGLALVAGGFSSGGSLSRSRSFRK